MLRVDAVHELTTAAALAERPRISDAGGPSLGSSDAIGHAATPAGTVSFGDILTRVVTSASDADRTSAAKVDALAAGASDDIHGTMISLKEAEISVKLVGSIRNKLLDAFHELWRTNV